MTAPLLHDRDLTQEDAALISVACRGSLNDVNEPEQVAPLAVESPPHGLQEPIFPFPRHSRSGTRGAHSGSPASGRM